MSKRHQAHRRRTYGRRQHELHERRLRQETWHGFSIRVVDIEDAEDLDAFESAPRVAQPSYGFGRVARWLAEAG